MTEAAMIEAVRAVGGMGTQQMVPAQVSPAADPAAVDAFQAAMSAGGVEKPTAIQEGKPTIAKPAVEPVTTNAAGLKIDPRYPYTDGREVLSSTTNNFDQIIDMCIIICLFIPANEAIRCCRGHISY